MVINSLLLLSMATPAFIYNYPCQQGTEKGYLEMEQIKIGLVGAGNIGQRHIMAIDQLVETELVAIADPSEVAQEKAASRGIPCYGNAAEMLEVCTPDAVIIATPTERHQRDVIRHPDRTPPP